MTLKHANFVIGLISIEAGAAGSQEIDFHPEATLTHLLAHLTADIPPDELDIVGHATIRSEPPGRSCLPGGQVRSVGRQQAASQVTANIRNLTAELELVAAEVRLQFASAALQMTAL